MKRTIDATTSGAASAYLLADIVDYTTRIGHDGLGIILPSADIASYLPLYQPETSFMT